jgi:CO/xanthine dehydrogenase Mo-binding subunit
VPQAQLSMNLPRAHHKRHARQLQAVGSNWDNPHYTKSFSMSSSACITAFQQFHAVNQSAEILFRTGIIPAAIKLWDAVPDETALSGDCWKAGELRVHGFKPLKLSDIAQVIQEQRGVTEVMVHACYAAAWVEATYQVGQVKGRWQIDGLSTRNAGSDQYDWHARSQTRPPTEQSEYYGRSLYSPSATIAAVLVHPKSGKVEVTDIHSYLDAGKVHQPELVSGQYQGGVAMGVGYALLEDCPSGDGGPGNGRWNLNRYHVPLARDLPLDRITLELLPPLGEQPTGKGIAESVLCPIAPAIANAISDATGHVFANLPITASRIREALKS